MRNPWEPEICRMPDGGGGDGGGFGDGPGYGMDEAGHGNTGNGSPTGAAAGPTGAGPSGYGSEADWGSTADAAELSAAGAQADHNDAMDIAYGYDALQGLPSSMAGHAYSGMDSMGLGLGLQGKEKGNWGARGGAIAGLFTGPLSFIASPVLSALGAHFVDGRSVEEAAGMGIGSFAGGPFGPMGSAVGSVVGGVVGDATNVGFDTALSNAFDIGDFSGDPGAGPSSDGIGGGSDFVPGMPGETYLPYLDPPTPQALPPQPAWRGLLGQTPAPQPNYWQGNSLFVPSRGLLR